MMKIRTPWMVALAAGTLTSCAFAQVNNAEVEANETKATATTAASGGAGMASGDTISGNTTGTSTTVAGATSADIFRVKTAAAPLGIYRHRLALTTTGTAGHIGAILGLTQSSTGIGTALSTFQSSSSTTTPARFNQWYGFGKQEELFYRVTGTATTTADYLATLETTPVTPISGPTLPPGNVVISTIISGPTTGLVTDTDLWVYDSNFNAIPGYGNDDESIAGGGTGVTFQSRLTRAFTPGTYFLAISRFGFANDQASPADDDFRSGAVLDFPNALACSSGTTPSTIALTIGGQSVPVTYTDSYGVAFVQFTVANILGASCTSGTNTVVEGQTANLSVTVTPAPGVPVTSVTVNASSINPAATSVALSDPDNDNIWTGTVQATVLASGAAFSLPFSVVDAASTTASGACSITVTATPSGACCLTSGCAVISEYNCSLQSGTFSGAGTDCGSQSYGPGTTTGTFTSISATGTPVFTGVSVDDSNVSVALPFPFTFYGNSFNSIGVVSNGFAQFTGTSTAFGNGAIPSTLTPNNALYPMWDDLAAFLSPSTNVFTQVDGTAPNRTFTISWENIGQYATDPVTFALAPVGSNNFQVVLFEGSNNIEYRYGAIDAITAPLPTVTDAVTIGVENAAGTVAVSVDPATIVGIGNVAVAFDGAFSGSPCTIGCDDIDFNNNGVFPEDQDVVDFFEVLAGGTPGTCDPVEGCNDIDFNNNSVFPEDQDVVDFFNVLAGGNCPS